MKVINNIKQALANLQERHRFFVSEADFQHTLAVELEKIFGKNADILLEFPIEQDNRIIYTDIMIIHKNKLYPIELKYKTKIIPSEKQYENTKLPIVKILKDHNAVDLGCYDFWKDINRIERLVNNNQVVSGVCIMITNDKFYWSGVWKHNSKGFPFRILPDKYSKGFFNWQNYDLHNVPKYIKQHPGFDITNDYNFQWQDFMNTGDKNGLFRSLFIEIPEKTQR